MTAATETAAFGKDRTLETIHHARLTKQRPSVTQEIFISHQQQNGTDDKNKGAQEEIVVAVCAKRSGTPQEEKNPTNKN